MATLKQKFETMLEFQEKIESIQKELDRLMEEKRAKIQAFNAPVIQSLENSIRSFLAGQLKESGEKAFDISDIGISINTGEYDDLNMGGAEGEIIQEVHELKLDEDGHTVLVGYHHYCAGNEWGGHDARITESLSILRRIADYLADSCGAVFEASTSALVFNGDRDYYQKRINETDKRCNEFGMIPKKKDDKNRTKKVSPLVAKAESYLKTILEMSKTIDKFDPEDIPREEIGVLWLAKDGDHDHMIVSRGNYADINIHSANIRCEIVKTACSLFLHYGKVMVGFKVYYRETVGFEFWHQSNKAERVPFAECAEWTCETKEGTKGFLLDEILERIEACSPSIAFALPGPREFSTGAFTSDGRYDSTGNLMFDEGITRIESHYYEGCDKVEVVRIPDGITEIGEGAFRGCSSLRSVYLPGSLVRIDGQAFEGCAKLQKVIFPKGLLSIGSNAFSGCQSLKCINLPDSLEFLGSNAFSGVEPCYVSHGQIRIERATIGIDEETVLIDRQAGFQSEKRDALGDFLSKAKDERANQSYFAIPEGIAGIDISNMNYMISPLQMPMEIWIPDSVADVFCRFGGSQLVTRITVSPDNPRYDSRGDCNAVIEKKTSTLVWGCANTIIPDSVKAIGDSAFDRCEGLTSISIPEGVTTIGEAAFALCPYLGKVHFPDSLEEIGDAAFIDSYSLKEIVIPDGVKKIGDDAFGEITIRTVSIPKGLDISGTGLDEADQIIER